MKKRISIFASVLIICKVLYLDIAVAAPQLGKPCKQEGSVGHFEGKGFTCALVGKKLTWISSNGIFQGGPSSASKSDLNVDPFVAKVYNAYDHKACKSSHPNFDATYVSTPNYSLDMLKKQKVLFEQAMSCYNNYFDRKITINIALATENDFDFMASQTTNGKPVFDLIQLRWIKFMMDRIGSGAGRFAGSAGWSKTTDSAWVIMIDSSKNTQPDAHGAAHEFVHILQSYSKSPISEFYGDGSNDATYLNLPPWFWEGTAELFSYASITSSAGLFSAQMAVARSQANGAPSMKKINSSAEVVSTLQKLVAPSNQEANMMNYALGSVACEYLLGTYGYAK